MMSIVEMLFQASCMYEMPVAARTIVVMGTLSVVLSQSVLRCKVPLARIADVMARRVLLMLLKSTLILELTIAAVAVGHRRKKSV